MPHSAPVSGTGSAEYSDTTGKTNGAIATILAISARTVQHHLDHIYRKLDVENRSAAVARALTAPAAQT